MKIYKQTLVLTITIFLSGCAVLDAIIPKSESPKTPKEFRKVLLSNPMGKTKIEKFTVNKPLAYVKSRLKKRYKTCLNRTHKSTSTNTNRGFGYTSHSTSHIYTKYTPTLKTYRKKLVLSIQAKRRGEGISIGSNSIDPPKGPYFMVIDAFKMKGKKTKIVVYRWDFKKYGVISKAVVNWASGKSTACPDFSEVNKPNLF